MKKCTNEQNAPVEHKSLFLSKSGIITCIFIALLFCGIGFLVYTKSTAKQGVFRVEYVPFRTSEDAKWGMISMDGKVLFEGRFENMPTKVTNGVFMVKNKNDMWEMYAASENPTKIGGEYKEICNFSGDLTPAVKENEKITLIDKKGNVKVTLDKINGKRIVKCWPFKNGLAEIETEDGLNGVIDTEGKVVVAPNYKSIRIVDEGNIFAWSVIRNSEEDYWNYDFFDSKGEIMLNLKTGKGRTYDNADIFSSSTKYICVTTHSDYKRGFINYQKEVMPVPFAKVYNIEILGDYFVYSGERNWGLMNMDGEVLVPEEFDRLSFACEDLLICLKDHKYNLMDFNGNFITNKGFEDFYPFEGERALVEFGLHNWGFIDKKGNVIKSGIYETSMNNADVYVTSDYSEEEDFVGMDLTLFGLKGHVKSVTMTSSECTQSYFSPKSLKYDEQGTLRYYENSGGYFSVQFSEDGKTAVKQLGDGINYDLVRDSQGRLIKMIPHLQDDEYQMDEYNIVWDSQGLVTEITFNTDGGNPNMTVTYDSNNMPSKIVMSGYTTDEYTITYSEFDSHGNWTKRDIEYYYEAVYDGEENIRRSFQETRTITYFD